MRAPVKPVPDADKTIPASLGLPHCRTLRGLLEDSAELGLYRYSFQTRSGSNMDKRSDAPIERLDLLG